MGSRPESKYPVRTVRSLGLQTIWETTQMPMPDAATAESSTITGGESGSSPDGGPGISMNGATRAPQPSNLLDPGYAELLPLKRESSIDDHHGQELDKKDQSVSPNWSGNQLGVTPKPAPETQNRAKKLRVIWKDVPNKYYSTNRHTGSGVEVSHKTPPRRSDSGLDDILASSLPPEAAETEHIPVGDHWGSLKHAGMSMKKAFTDPEFASKWKTDQEKPAGFMSMIHMLFNQVQEAAWPCHVQSASVSKRLLITITIMGRVGAFKLWVTEDTLVKQVIQLALVAYEKEARFPVLGVDASKFELYLSPFTTSALRRDEKICDTGARNFVLGGQGLSGPDFRRRMSTPCAQQSQMRGPSSYTSLQLYDSGAESPTEGPTLAKVQHHPPWLPSTLMRCIPV